MAELKLPGITYGGVKGLGRYEVNAPMRAANAAAAAATAEARAFGRVTNALAEGARTAMNYYEANAAAEYDRALAEISRHEKRLRGMLTSGPVIDTQQWNLPEWVDVPGGRYETVTDEAGNAQTVQKRYIPTHHIAEQMYSGSMTRVQDAVMQGVTNPKAAGQLRRKLPTVLNEGAAAVAIKQHAHYVDWQKGEIATSIEMQIQAGDERAARMAAARAHAVGLYDREDYEKAMKEIGSRIDEQTLTVAMLGAQSSDELADVAIQIRESRIDPGTKRSMVSSIHTRQKQLDDEQDDAREEFSKNALALGLDYMFNGKLTPPEADQLWNAMEPADRVTFSRAMSQWQDTEYSRRDWSDPDVYSGFMAQVSAVSFPEGNVTVQEATAQARKALRRAQANGQLGVRDFQYLDEKLTQQSQLAYNTEEYRTTKRSIWVEVTGVTNDHWEDMVWQAEKGSAAMRAEVSRMQTLVREANKAVADLQGVISVGGAQVDIVEWWAKNRGKYGDAQSIIQNQREGFLRRHPQYAPQATPGGESRGSDGTEVLRAIRGDTSIPEQERNRRFAEFKTAMELDERARQ